MRKSERGLLSVLRRMVQKTSILRSHTRVPRVSRLIKFERLYSLLSLVLLEYEAQFVVTYKYLE